MPTPDTETHGVGGAAKQVAEHASALARLELELATLEVKKKVAALGAGAGLGVGALLLVLYAFGFGLAAAAAGLATTMDAWLALVIVTGVLVLVAALLGLLAVGRFKKGAPPVPEQAIAEAKLTGEALSSSGGNGRV